jgi:WD40 repeat protein
MLAFRAIMATTCAWWIAVCLAPAQVYPARENEAAPKIAFRWGKVTAALQQSPDGNVKIKVSGSTARLYDPATEKLIGKTLEHDAPQLNLTATMTIHCWAFSPDGKFVVTGAGYKRGKAGEADNEGQICVWEIATGLRVATCASRLGSVVGVAFSKDSQVVLFEAERYEVDGP